MVRRLFVIRMGSKRGGIFHLERLLDLPDLIAAK